MRTLWGDVRYGARLLVKHPGFTSVAMIALALGIGATTAIFSVVNAVLLRPLPYENPERLVQVWENNLPRGWVQDPVSPRNFIDWQGQSRSFEALAAYEYESFTLTGSDASERIGGALVSASLIEVMGTRPALGRGFLSEEDRRGVARVVILSDRLWQRRFGARPDVIGQSLILNNESFTVVGVMPPAFQFPSQSVDLWATPAFDPSRPRSDHFLYAVGRLKPTVSLRQAREEMDHIARQLAEQYPDTNKDFGVTLISLHEQVVGKIRPALLILLGAVVLMLLIACVNVANLLLARATARQKEIAVRTALGASRLRLIRQHLTESLLLAGLGGCCGLLLSVWGVDLLVAASAGTLPRAKEISIDGRVFGFTLTISLVTGILFGLAPALRSSTPDLNQFLKEGVKGVAGGWRQSRAQSVLVVAEITLGLVLLIGAGLLIKSYARLQQVDPGFSPENVLTAQLSLPQSKYPEERQQALFFQQTLERIQTLPGVEYAGAVSDLPFSQSRTSRSFGIEGRPAVSDGESLNADHRKISPHYFRAMGIRLLRGREFTERDAKNAPGVIIINEAMARRFFPHENPLGRRLLLGASESGEQKAWEIVGVVADIKHGNLAEERKPEMYVPYMQHPHSWMFLAIRGASDPRTLIAAVRNAVREVDPEQPAYNVMTMQERIEKSIAPQRFNTLLLGVFAVVAIALAAVGIYGVVSYSVAQRTREIGVRLALGAQSGDILRLVVGQGMLLTMIGIGLGLAAALLLTRLMASLLYGVSATDPFVFAGIAVLLAFVALLACYIPARRATKVDPMIALRYE